jgi:predicted RNA-binding Zn ribbon-like protein
VARLRALRSWLRDSLSAEGPGDPPALLAPVTVTAGRHGVTVTPGGRDAACAVSFYDRSKHNSRIWHNLARCGTPMHVRAYRDRQRAASPAD